MLSLLFAAAAQAACTVLSGGQVYLEAGVEDVTVVLDEGDIVGVGRQLRNLRINESDGKVTGAVWGGRSCDWVDISGQHLTPGLIAVPSHLGLVEVELEKETVDVDPGGDPVRADLRAADAYNPMSSVIPIQRTWGITSAVTVPVGGLVSGMGAWVDLVGATRQDAVIDAEVSMQVNLRDGGSRADAVYRLRELLDDTRDFMRNRSSWERNQRRDYVTSKRDLTALTEVLAKRIPLVVSAHRAADIEGLLALAEEYDVRLVINGGTEAWLLADKLAATKTSVILDPLAYGAGSFDQIHARPDGAALLVAAGVPLVLSSYETHNARTLRQVAGNAVRGGLSHHAAMMAITAGPADAFMQPGYGRVAAGFVGNVVVWDGDPLELSSRPTRIWIHGDEIDLGSRQVELLRRYRSLPGTPRPPLNVGAASSP
jgi:imidazolonepropionase-like amidohydrolase